MFNEAHSKELYDAAIMCGHAIRRDETELQSLRRQVEGRKRLHVLCATRAIQLEAALEVANRRIAALLLAVEHQLPEQRAEDIWSALVAKANTEGAMHKSDMIAVLKGLGFK